VSGTLFFSTGDGDATDEATNASDDWLHGVSPPLTTPIRRKAKSKKGKKSKHGPGPVPSSLPRPPERRQPLDHEPADGQGTGLAEAVCSAAATGATYGELMAICTGCDATVSELPRPPENLAGPWDSSNVKLVGYIGRVRSWAKKTGLGEGEACADAIHACMTLATGSP
jgi:hypothetical protein